jgi:phospholipid/cholesterol/gamma-HCH transport system substrate-binding protein
VTSEAKVGIVALLVIAAVIVSWSKLGGLARLRGEYTVIVCFDDLRGLPIGAPVRLNGVKIGEVRSADLVRHVEFPTKTACATLAIEQKYTLFVGDTFQVSSGSLLGDKHIKVTRGVKPSAALDKKTIALIGGSGPAGIEALTENAEALSGEAKGTVSSVNELLRDEQMRADLKATLANMNKLSVRATDIATKALALVDQLQPQDARKVQTMVDNLYEVSRSLRRTAAGVNAMVSTTTMPQDLDKLSTNLVDASESVRKSTEAVAGIIADPKVSEDLRATLENVREVSTTGVELADKTGQVLDRVDSIATKVDTAIGGLPTFEPPFRDMDAEGFADVRWGAGRASRINVDVDLYPDRYEDSFWRVGVRGLGGDEKLDLQRGIPLGHRGERLRVGVFDSELGVGWDRNWSPRLSSEVELMDPGEFRLDIRGRYRYDQDWDLLFGVDRALSGTEPFIGARRYFDF